MAQYNNLGELPHKPDVALDMIKNQPELWFRDQAIDARDRRLLNANRLPWVNYGQSSYLRKMYAMAVPTHNPHNQQIDHVDWTVELDACKVLISRAGGQLFRFGELTPQLTPAKAMSFESFAHLTVNVNIKGKNNPGFDWGLLSTAAKEPGNVRIFKGPLCWECHHYTWDAVILRNCRANSGGMHGTVADGRWDILCMKMCEDYDHPWVVVAISDASAYPDQSGEQGCATQGCCNPCTICGDGHSFDYLNHGQCSHTGHTHS